MVNVGTQAASIELPGLHARKKMIMKKMSLINQAALAADNTNYLQVQLLAAPSGAVLAEIDTRAANEGALVKNVAKHAPEVELEIPAGSDLVVNVVKNGTGVPTLAVVQLEMYKV
jgi:hypothetical protein